MATSNDITLTKALYGITKTTAKISFVFFILTAILISVTLNAGNPNINTYTLHDQEENFLYGFQISDGDSEIQIGYVVINNDWIVDYIEFRVEKVSPDGLQVSENVIFSRSQDFFRQLSLDPGSYRVFATAYFVENAESAQDVEIASGHGSFNLVLVGLSVLAIVIASVSMGIFFAVLPFTIFMLIFNSINNSSKPRYVKPTKRKEHSEIEASTQTSQPVYSSPSKPKVTPFNFDPESFAAKLTTKDWAWLAIALIAFIGFLFEPDSPFLFFALIIPVVIIYSVSEREKTKLRMLNLLNTYNHTSVDFLKVQLDKKIKYVIKVLQYMILDDAMPIRLDMETLDVTVVGSLTPFLPQKEFARTTSSHQSSSNNIEQSTQGVVSNEVNPIVQVLIPDDSQIEMHCTACGEGLIGKPKYCYICGQKTI
ncbi:MAG: hypothetical protein GPJ54_13245 [Candidatus Heimdallarchaeota archaeon]|nr:hypothetical protein [Candidatus Heimdallarchaeota archaeon]